MHACPSGTSRTRQVAAAVIGNALEWYDFIVYGFLFQPDRQAVLPFRRRVHLAVDGPGHLRCRFLHGVRSVGSCSACMPTAGGRKAAMQLIILLMTLSIAMIAFAPTYAAIGVGAPLLIVIARMLQGFAHRRRVRQRHGFPGGKRAAAPARSLRFLAIVRPVPGGVRRCGDGRAGHPLPGRRGPWRAGAGGCRSCSVC
ncbi:MFS transporter [Pseudomonas aeruginosa]|nr:MFS transporter [Pseudomonas aeruginosa]